MDTKIDQTIGEEFTFEVYSNKWGRHTCHKLKHIETGWVVNCVTCDKDGEPTLFMELDRDNINYPHSLWKRMEWLWEQSKKGWSKEDIQEGFDELGKWLKEVELATPRGKGTIW